MNKMTKYVLLVIEEDGIWRSMYYERNTIEEEIAIMNQEEKEHYGYTYNEYYKFVIELPDRSCNLDNREILYAPSYISFMKGWTVKKAQEWIREKYLKEHPELNRKSIPYLQLLNANKNAKYEVVAVSYDGKYGVVANGNTPNEALKNWEKLDADGLDKYIDYPYVLVIPAHKGSKRNILKQRIVDADILDIDPGFDFKFVKGWTVERAIKKIVAENKKAEQENPDEPLLWGVDSGL